MIHEISLQTKHLLGQMFDWAKNSTKGHES